MKVWLFPHSWYRQYVKRGWSQATKKGLIIFIGSDWYVSSNHSNWYIRQNLPIRSVQALLGNLTPGLPLSLTAACGIISRCHVENFCHTTNRRTIARVGLGFASKFPSIGFSDWQQIGLRARLLRSRIALQFLFHAILWIENDDVTVHTEKYAFFSIGNNRLELLRLRFQLQRHPQVSIRGFLVW